MRESSFVNADARARFEAWAAKVRARSSTPWVTRSVDTELGPTHVMSSGPDEGQPAMVCLPGFGTCGAFWDLDDALARWAEAYRVHVVDVVGQPGHSSGRCPAIRGPGYGRWLVEVLDNLQIDRATVVGASFGGSLIAHLAEQAPERVAQSVFLAPAGFIPVRPSPGALLAMLAALWLPSPRRSERMLELVVEGQDVPEPARTDLLEVLTLFHAGFRPRAQAPIVMPASSFAKLTGPSHVLIGAHDRLIDPPALIARAREVLPDLRHAEILPNHGHGLEISRIVVERVRGWLS